MKLIVISENDTGPLQAGHTGHNNLEQLLVFRSVLLIFFDLFKYAKTMQSQAY